MILGSQYPSGGAIIHLYADRVTRVSLAISGICLWLQPTDAVIMAAAG